MDLVSTQICNRHVALTPGLILRIQDDPDASRPVLRMKEIYVVYFTADRGAVLLAIVLIQGNCTLAPTDTRKQGPVAPQDGVIEVLLEPEHVAIVPNGIDAILHWKRRNCLPKPVVSEAALLCHGGSSRFPALPPGRPHPPDGWPTSCAYSASYHPTFLQHLVRVVDEALP